MAVRPTPRLSPGSYTTSTPEYSEPTPPPDVLTERIRQLLAAAQTLGGADLCGLAVLRFHPSPWTPGSECYLAEL